MKKEKLDRIIKILREEFAGPTNSMAGGNIAGSKEAGDTPPVDLRKRKTRDWNPFFKQLAKVMRRKK